MKKIIFFATLQMFRIKSVGVFLLFVSMLLFASSHVALAQNKMFEGEIHYAKTITTDKTILKLYPSAQNGEYTERVIRRGQDELCEESIGICSLYLLSKKEGYIWSDQLKKGYKFDMDVYRAYQDSVFNSNNYNFFPIGEKKNMFGYNIRCYYGKSVRDISFLGLNVKERNEFCSWVCDDYPCDYINEIRCPGMMFSCEYRGFLTIPLAGEAQQHYTSHIVSITERKVDDSELCIPSDIVFEFTIKPLRAYYKLYKETYKYRKKNKENSGFKKEGTYQHKGEFDF